jgi:hypothetical protein
VLARPVFRDRSLSVEFLERSLGAETVPLAGLAIVAILAAANRSRGAVRNLAPAVVLLLVVQRPLEIRGVYPTQDASRLESPDDAGPLEVARAAATSDGSRVVAARADLRPNGAALLGLEDVRGYESIVLDRFADTFPLWCAPQHASFNRVDDPTRPFLAFLGARFAVAPPDAAPPSGWTVPSRSRALALFENPRALPRAFVPRRVVSTPDPLGALLAAQDFAEAVWIAGASSEAENPRATVAVRESGPDLLLDVDAAGPCLVATSVPDWPGWRVVREEAAGGPAIELVTVDHAFVGLRAPAGRTRLRLSYRAPGFAEGLGAFAVGALAAALVLSRRK